METEKPLTRDSLVSMQVIDAKGHLLGKVKDVTFAVGKTGFSLTVENNTGEVKNIAWDDVQAASDFIVLKATSATQPSHSQSSLCPTCGKPLTWIPQYQRWYCYNDKKYV